jgi:Ala-tRNA(Pro) deacylase
MAVMTWIEEMLDQRGLSYEELAHREVFTAQEVAQREHVSGHRMAKVVAVMADDRVVALVVPASRRVILDQVRECLGAKRVRLASEAEMSKCFTDCELGAIPPLRHWGDVEVLMDTSMTVDGDILLQAGTHRDVIRMNYKDWFTLVNPRVGAFTEPEESAVPSFPPDREDEEEPLHEVYPDRGEDSVRESGLPGGGKGRIDEVGRSGVYPASGPFPEGAAEIKTPGAWVHGQRDESGREVEGGSEILYFERETLLGGETPPSSGPATVSEPDSEKKEP